MGRLKKSDIKKNDKKDNVLWLPPNEQYEQNTDILLAEIMKESYKNLADARKLIKEWTTAYERDYKGLKRLMNDTETFLQKTAMPKPAECPLSPPGSRCLYIPEFKPVIIQKLRSEYADNLEI